MSRKRHWWMGKARLVWNQGEITLTDHEGRNQRYLATMPISNSYVISSFEVNYCHEYQIVFRLLLFLQYSLR